jgi:serine/threonine protein kinase/tetratricopeptide (TPR) repeat protein
LERKPPHETENPEREDPVATKPRADGVGRRDRDDIVSPRTSGEAADTISLHDPNPASTSPSQSFVSGQIVAGRYRVLRFVARGGMGEVYEVEDTVLRERVALKIIRPEIAEDPSSLERFRREIYLARKVTHGNVCRIFDIGHHRDGGKGGQPAAITFLTMEMLEGESLLERIRRNGRLSTDEAFQILRQMAAGIDAAHRVGITHRDFKSGNVILLPGEADGGPGRVVVTDFGLARSGTESSSEASILLTAVGDVVGTPAYMAPEQVEGSDVGPRADIYALGVVLFEMVTGTLPFSGDTALAVAVRRLKEDPPHPSATVPDIDPIWEKVILRAMARKPADRFERAEEIVYALETGRLPRPDVPKRRSAARWGAGALAAATLAVAVFVAWDRGLLSRVASRRPQNAHRVSLAVLGFENLAGKQEATWISTALTEAISTELSSSGTLRIVSGESVSQARNDLGLSLAQSFSGETLSRLRKLLGCDYVVSGSFVSTGEGDVQLDARLEDVSLGETIARSARAGNVSNLPALASLTASTIKEKLGLGKRRWIEGPSKSVPLPAHAEAARLYSEGLERLRLFDARHARELLEQATQLEPEFVPARSALAEAWRALGYETRAREIAREAWNLARDLPVEDRLLIEGRMRELDGEWAKAVECHRRRRAQFPDDLEAGLDLASAEIRGGSSKGAFATLEELRKSLSRASDDPRVDLVEADAASQVSDFRRQREAAVRAAEKARSLGARQLLARALLSAGSADRFLGNSKEARSRFDEARKLSSEAGDRRGVARALSWLAVLHGDDGDFTAARAMHEEALATNLEIGNDVGVADAQNNIAILLGQQERLGEARKRFEDAARTYRKLDRTESLAAVLGNLTNVLIEQSDLDLAERTSREALDLHRKLADRNGEASTLGCLGQISYLRGDLKNAVSQVEAAVAICRDNRFSSLLAVFLTDLAELRLTMGNLEGARTLLTEAAATGDETEIKPEKRLVLVRLLLEEGRPAEAEAVARTILLKKQELGATPVVEAAAHAHLARALFDQGKKSAARGEARQARALAEKCEALPSRLAATIAAARVDGLASGRSGSVELRKTIESALSTATKRGIFPLALEARLALAELAAEQDPSGDSEDELRRVRQEAHKTGFVLLSRITALPANSTKRTPLQD